LFPWISGCPRNITLALLTHQLVKQKNILQIHCYFDDTSGIPVIWSKPKDFEHSQLVVLEIKCGSFPVYILLVLAICVLRPKLLVHHHFTEMILNRDVQLLKGGCTLENAQCPVQITFFRDVDQIQKS